MSYRFMGISDEAEEFRASSLAYLAEAEAYAMYAQIDAEKAQRVLDEAEAAKYTSE